MADYRDAMNRNRIHADRSQPRSTEDTRGYEEEQFEDVEELDENVEEFEFDERVTGEVGSEGGGEGNVKVSRQPGRERMRGSESGDISEP
jgi:hypothetical protein